jgi:2-oxoglutarate/2-oxoacid ferredoxin oxidoreductase subunit beta
MAGWTGVLLHRNRLSRWCMDSLLNHSRPPAFCPGCSYDRIVHTLDRTLIRMGLPGGQVVLVTDIGCSGLLDVFFMTHAFHGLHGRALTYATGLKMANPDLQVIVIMGDGGVGIGGAHFQAACRRNLDLTLLVLNNFNYGMTGGQYSATSPIDAATASGFLNRLEQPLDICRLADAAGAPFVARISALASDLSDVIECGLRFSGFAVIDIPAICTGRYARKNKVTPEDIDKKIARMPAYHGLLDHNQRREYGEYYQHLAAEQKMVQAPPQINPAQRPPVGEKIGLIIVGNAGQRISTAGELLALAGITGGFHVTQKNSNDITVLRGASISEVVLWPEQIGFTGIEQPDVILALGQEGVNRRKSLFSRLKPDSFVLCAQGVVVPDCSVELHHADFKKQSIRDQDWALAALALLAGWNRVINPALLQSALKNRFRGDVLASALKLVEAVIDKHSVIIDSRIRTVT